MFPFGGNQGNNNQQQQPYNPYQGCEITRTSTGSSSYMNSETIRPDNTGKALDTARNSNNMIVTVVAIIVGLIFAHSAFVHFLRSASSSNSSDNQIERNR